MKRLFLVLSILILFFAVIPEVNAAASLYLSPSTGTYTVDKTFSIEVKANTGGEAINAAEGSIVFDPDELQVVSIAKTGSIFTLWTKEPTFSNSSGSIEFGGGLPNPGFSGSAGMVITITFKAMRATTTTTTTISFSSGAALANDGQGTNILKSMGNGSYIISPKGITPAVPTTPPAPTVPLVPPIGATPSAPIIIEPPAEKWISDSSPTITWDLPSDITGVSLRLDKNSVGDPGPLSDGLINSKQYAGLEDGIWHLHIKFRNQYGWGQITHHKISIDTVPPKPFEIAADNEGDSTNPAPILKFETKDELSGIDFYDLTIDGREGLKVTPQDLKEPARTPVLPPGEYALVVKANDRAGNFSLASKKIVIEAIEPPIISEFPRRLALGESLTIKGTALPNSTVSVYAQKDEERVQKKDVKADSEGNWIFTYDKRASKGIYTVWLEATDARGAKSNPTDKITLAVELPTLLRFGKIAIDYLTVVITLLVLIGVAIMMAFYAWFRIGEWRKRLRKETRETEESVHKAFGALKEEVGDQVEKLDSKPGLSKSEKEVRDKLKEALDVSEEFITKEVKDVEKELE